MGKREDLISIRNKCLSCRKCSIGGQMIEGKFLSNVFSNMNCNADIMVVGQNPGRDEVEKGEPFVGVSGKMFDQVLEETIGMTRDQLYISNTVRCMTPGNRRPTSLEIDNCEPILEEEIKALKPKMIISLGGPAFTQLTGMNGIMKHHGTPTFSAKYGVFVFPLLHPSPINLNDPDKMELFVADLLKMDDFIKGGMGL